MHAAANAQRAADYILRTTFADRDQTAPGGPCAAPGALEGPAMSDPTLFVPTAGQPFAQSVLGYAVRTLDSNADIAERAGDPASSVTLRAAARELRGRLRELLEATRGECRTCGQAITLAGDGAWEGPDGACGCGVDEHSPGGFDPVAARERRSARPGTWDEDTPPTT